MKDLGSLGKYLADEGKVKKMMSAVSGEDAKKLESMIDRDSLSSALAGGDVKSLENILRQVLNTGEGRELARKISGILDK